MPFFDRAAYLIGRDVFTTFHLCKASQWQPHSFSHSPRRSSPRRGRRLHRRRGLHYGRVGGILANIAISCLVPGLASAPSTKRGISTVGLKSSFPHPLARCKHLPGAAIRNSRGRRGTGGRFSLRPRAPRNFKTRPLRGRCSLKPQGRRARCSCGKRTSFLAGAIRSAAPAAKCPIRPRPRT